MPRYFLRQVSKVDGTLQQHILHNNRKKGERALCGVVRRHFDPILKTEGQFRHCFHCYQLVSKKEVVSASIGHSDSG